MYIYEIVNIKNGKRYIGQTVDASNKRLNQHRYLLRSKKHSNLHLQSAWNKYGEDAFQFNKIKSAQTVSKLDKLEIKYIRLYNTENRMFGYNIFTGGHQNHSVPPETRLKIGIRNKGNTHTTAQKLKWSKEKRHRIFNPVIGPDNKRKTIHNLREFCRQHNLDRANMGRVLAKKSYQHRGWRLVGTPKDVLDRGLWYSRTTRRIPRQKLRRPDGKPVIIDVIDRFCQEHHLSTSHIRSVLQNKRYSHKGWTLA